MTKLSAEIISFDDAGADDDHPVKGITMGHIRRWFDRIEQHETNTLPGIGECTDEMAHAMSGLDGYDHDRDMPTLQRWKDYWDAAIAAAPHVHAQPQTVVHSGTYLGYRDEHGNEMHCANAFCPHQAECRKGCTSPVSRPQSKSEG